MRWIYMCIAVLVFSLFQPGILPGQSRLEGLLRDVAAEFRKQMEKEKIVGGALVILNRDRVLLKEHYGWANEEKKIPASDRTIYVWGSITKTMTCIAAMQLQWKGRLRIDDPLVDYIPSFRNIDNPFGNTEQITLKMIMSHTAGLQNASFIIPLSWHGVWPRWEQLEPVFNYMKVEYPPGSRYSYSNFGLLLIGRVIEVVTRDDYETYMDKNIFKPLRMYDSYFDTTPYHLLKFKAQGYYKYEEGKPRKLYHPDVDQGVTTSNGGLKSSIADFCKYVRFLLGSTDSQQQAVYDGVLPRKILESMWQPVHPLPDPEKGSIGLGFHIYTDLKYRYIGHTGSANGFISQMMLHPESGVAFFSVGNTENMRAVNRSIRRYIDEHLMPVLIGETGR